MKKFFHRKPVLTYLASTGLILAFICIFYLYTQVVYAAPASVRYVPTMAIEMQPADSWTLMEQWITRVFLIGAAGAFLGAVIWYFFRGKNWESMKENADIQTNLNATLRMEVAELNLDIKEMKTVLARSRQIRIGQRKIIFRLIARLEGEGKEFQDIMSAEEDFDFDITK